jgi:hypothetical protein
VEIVEASFPSDQKLARTSEMRITVRNAGRKTIPYISVTVGPPQPGAPQGAGNAETESPFSYQDPKNEDPSKPIFVVNKEPEGGDTAFQRTWSLGSLRPGQEKTFVWELTAVDAKPFDFRYQVSAGLDGRAKAVLAGAGGPPVGRFHGRVDPTPPDAKVADDGENIVSGGKVYIPRRPERQVEER